MGKNKPKGVPPPKKATQQSTVGLWPLGLGLLAIVAAFAISALQGKSASPGPPSHVQTNSAAASNVACNDDTGPDDDMCVAWHKAGLCNPRSRQRVRNSAGSPVLVRQACARTCGLCPGVPPRNPPVSRDERCRRDNQTAAVPAGQLNGVFEHIISAYPEYEPTSLSKSPHVLLLHNFITAEEAEAFKQVCHESFERSLAGDQLNPVRTSYQCWCNFAKCFTDPKVHAVTRRINNITRTPYDNGEDLQIVRYEPGQFYKRHHDQNTAVWAPQGPRVLTFFMYLNDPEDGGACLPTEDCADTHGHGRTCTRTRCHPPVETSHQRSLTGETAFPSVPSPDGQGHLIVKPKLGSAILWPSVHHERPMEADQRTDHEAMPVHKGIKYGANMWIHQVCATRM